MPLRECRDNELRLPTGARHPCRRFLHTAPSVMSARVALGGIDLHRALPRPASRRIGVFNDRICGVRCVDIWRLCTSVRTCNHRLHASDPSCTGSGCAPSFGYGAAGPTIVTGASSRSAAVGDSPAHGERLPSSCRGQWAAGERFPGEVDPSRKGSRMAMPRAGGGRSTLLIRCRCRCPIGSRMNAPILPD